MTTIEKVSRRDFLRRSGLGTGAFVLGCHVAPRALFAGDAEPSTSFAPNAFLAIDGDGTVTIMAHRSEMGQGIRTGLPAVVADELEADWERVVVRQADGDAKYVDQDTDGSRSVRQFFKPLREAGATARHMLVAAAASVWQVEVSECEARQHRVHHKASGRALEYGKLAPLAANLPVPPVEDVKLKPRDQFRYIGKRLPIVDMDDMVSGKAVYGADVRLPGMLVAVVERCPVVGSEPRSIDDKAALAVAGVKKVVRVDGKGGVGGGFAPLCGVAVIAENTWAAIRGRAALRIEWGASEHASYESAAYRAGLETTAKEPGRVVREEGDVAAAFAAAHKVVEASYYVPHLAQAPMEPPSATARVSGEGCEIWASTQSPMTAKTEVAKALGIEPDQVTVHVTLLGGGFGRKSKPDFIAEAAILSRDAGAPVKLLWTREDDIRHGYFHAVSSQYLKGGLDADGRPTAWLHRSVFPSISATFNASARQGSTGELSLGLIDLPFAVPNLCLENGEAEAHVRIGWMRSVANIYHAFAAGSFAGELAHAAGRDQKDFLLELIGPPRKVDLAARGVEYSNYGESLESYPIDTGRLRHVVEVAAREAGWGKELPARRGLGIAAHRSFLTYVAIVAEVEVDERGKLRVHEVHLAADCGTYVNPDRVRAQMEGAVIYGLSLALHGAVTAKDGAIVESNFHDYPVLRIHETPAVVAVHLVESEALPAGVGEPGVPPLAPAVTNAIFAATGRRVRELPLRKLGYV